MTRARTALVAIAVLVVGMAWIATPAQAHNYLVSSTPEADATVTEPPEEFTITTNDVLLDLGGAGNGFALQVLDAAGLYYGDGCVTVDGPSMTSEVALGEPGEYSVRWQVVSTDGHPVSDEYSFTWAPTDVADPGVAEPAVGADAAPVCGQEAEPSGRDASDDEAAADGTETEPAPDGSTEVGSTDPGPSAAEGPGSADGWWIGGAIAAAVVAVGAVVLVRRRGAG